MIERAKNIHVHILNRSNSSPVYHVTEARFAAARARHPDVAEKVRASFSYDGRGSDAALLTADAIIGFMVPKEDLASRAPQLKWIHVTGAGIDHLTPFDWVPSGVSITTSSGAHAPMARDFATMAVLLLNHNIPHFTTAKIARKYDQLFSTGVWKKTLAVIGVGHMGGAAANGAKRLGMRVIGIRQSREPHADVDEMFGPADLPQVLARADFVLVTTPLTAATTGLIGRREFDLMKPWAGLINMSRAGVVDYVALADKLRARELSGAVLDVFDPEPLPPTSFLWDVPNLILTPHVSSDEAEDYSAGCLDLFFENINRIQSERPIINQVDLVRGY